MNYCNPIPLPQIPILERSNKRNDRLDPEIVECGDAGEATYLEKESVRLDGSVHGPRAMSEFQLCPDPENLLTQINQGIEIHIYKTKITVHYLVVHPTLQ